MASNEAARTDDKRQKFFRAQIDLLDTRYPPENAAQVISRAREYFIECHKHEVVPNKAGLYYNLGYESVESANKSVTSDGLGLPIKRALHLVEQWLSDTAQSGKSGSMFLLKSQFDYRDSAPIDTSALLPGITIVFGNNLPGCAGESAPKMVHGTTHSVDNLSRKSLEGVNVDDD